MLSVFEAACPSTTRNSILRTVDGREELMPTVKRCKKLQRPKTQSRSAENRLRRKAQEQRVFISTTQRDGPKNKADDPRKREQEKRMQDETRNRSDEKQK